MKTFASSLRLRLLLIAGTLLIEGCSTLPLQKQLAGYVTDALQRCQAEPARCAAAQQCSHAATEAASAIQRARAAELANRVDEAALKDGVLAVSLPPAAAAQCQALGFKVVAPPSERVPPKPETPAPGTLGARIDAMATPAPGVQ